MLVDLKQKWFAPTEPFTLPDGRKISGQRYSKGIHEIPDELEDVLPPRAVILKHPPKAEEQEEVIETLRDHDYERKDMDNFEVMVEKAEEQRLLNLEDNNPHVDEGIVKQEPKKRGRPKKQ